MDLESLLIKFSNYGNPRVGKIDPGCWYCRIEINSPLIGVRLEINSKFDHPTPISAALECNDRLTDMLNERTQGPVCLK